MTSGRCSLSGLDESLAVDLDAEVHDVEAVVREHDVDEVLPDVVNVALDGGEEDLPVRVALLPLHVRLEVRTAAFIAEALCSTSATISSLALKSRPTSAMPAISGPLTMSSASGYAVRSASA